jgi:acyl-CoA synthetase (AMP-forming)/AMP-acid ligase II
MAFNLTVRSIVIGFTFALPLCIQFPPKSDELFRNIQVKNHLTVLVTVPSLLEELVEKLLSENLGLEPLKKLKFVMYGGAACLDELCKILVDRGVVLLSGYGATGRKKNNFPSKSKLLF